MARAGLEAGTQTLAEQPLLTGIRRFARSENPVDGLIGAAGEAPASFIPTVLGQMALYSEPTIKDARDRNF